MKRSASLALVLVLALSQTAFAQDAAPAAAPEAAPAAAPAAAPETAPAAAPETAPAAAPETAPAAAPAAAPETAPAAAPETAPAAAPAAAPAPAAEPAPVAAPAPEPEPAAEPEAAPEAATAADSDEPSPPFKLSVGMGLRTGLKFDPEGAGGNASLVLDDGIVDMFTARPYFSGSAYDLVGFEANFEGTSGGVVVLDAVVKLTPHELFNVWVGQFLPPSSRSNLSGPFYASAWGFPLLVHATPFDYAGRDRGFALFGQVAGGVFKYQVGLFDLEKAITGDQAMENMRFAGRLVLNLLDPEPGYYNSSTYYGSKDVLAIGATYQYQDLPSAAEDTLSWIQLDLLFEKNLGKGGVLTVEGSYWNTSGSGDVYNTDNTFVAVNPTAPGHSMFGLVGWMTAEKIGVGHIQPMVRVQWRDDDAPDMGGVDPQPITVVDGGINYIIDGHNTRLHLNYMHTSQKNGPSSNAIQFGTQIQMWIL